MSEFFSNTNTNKKIELTDSSDVFNSFSEGLFHPRIDVYKKTTYFFKDNSAKNPKDFIPSQFGTSLLSKKEMQPVLRPDFRHEWVFGIITFIILVLVYVKVNHGKRFKQLGKSLAGSRFVALLSREGGLFEHPGAFELFMVFILSASLIGYKVISYFGYHHNPNDNGFILFLQVGFLLTLTYIIKIFSYRFMGFIFRMSDGFLEYIQNVFLINEVLGLVLFPFALIICYTDPENIIPVFKLSLYVALLFYFFRIIRGVLIWKNYLKLHPFYLFLYFCTFEILPMLILIKSVSLFIN